MRNVFKWYFSHLDTFFNIHKHNLIFEVLYSTSIDMMFSAYFTFNSQFPLCLLDKIGYSFLNCHIFKWLFLSKCFFFSINGLLRLARFLYRICKYMKLINRRRDASSRLSVWNCFCIFLLSWCVIISLHISWRNLSIWLLNIKQRLLFVMILPHVIRSLYVIHQPII